MRDVKVMSTSLYELRSYINKVIYEPIDEMVERVILDYFKTRAVDESDVEQIKDALFVSVRDATRYYDYGVVGYLLSVDPKYVNITSMNNHVDEIASDAWDRQDTDAEGMFEGVILQVDEEVAVDWLTDLIALVTNEYYEMIRVGFPTTGPEAVTIHANVMRTVQQFTEFKEALNVLYWDTSFETIFQEDLSSCGMIMRGIVLPDEDDITRIHVRSEGTQDGDGVTYTPEEAAAFIQTYVYQGLIDGDYGACLINGMQVFVRDYPLSVGDEIVLYGCINV